MRYHQGRGMNPLVKFYDVFGDAHPIWLSVGTYSVDFWNQILSNIPPVKKLEHFEQKREYAVFCPVGQASFAEGVELISSAVRRCRREKIEKLLFDSTGLTNFRPPGMSEQYNLAERIASDAKSLVKIAHVASQAWIRSGKFGVMVATNRGLEARNFTSATAALKWLLTPAEHGAEVEAARL